MQLILITGLSGSGKSVALAVMEPHTPTLAVEEGQVAMRAVVVSVVFLGVTAAQVLAGALAAARVTPVSARRVAAVWEF